tara:strand:- start:786 stop:980 length:195 start_codon:yes stop_codon:yes gene_type:complete
MGRRRINMIKEWMCDIEIRFNWSGIEAETKEEFVKQIKEIFKEEYNLELDGREIKNIQDMTEED